MTEITLVLLFLKLFCEMEVLSSTTRETSDLNATELDSLSGFNDSLLEISDSLEHPGSIVKDNFTVPRECTSSHRYCESGSLEDGDYCSCKEDCYMHGDCCWGAPVPGDMLREVASDESLTGSCSEIRINESHAENIILMMKCPPRWRQFDDIRIFCEGTSINVDDALLNIPVTGNQTKVTYRNLFCALCNDDHDVLPWKLQAKCPSYTRKLQKCKLDPEFKYITRKGKKQPILEIPNELRGAVRKCVNVDIASCPDQWPKTPGNMKQKVMVQKSCHNFVAPVSTTNEKGETVTYKNKFCAFCNGITASRLRCHLHNDTNRTFENEKAEDDIEVRLVVKSFSVLLDIDFIHGGLIVGTKRRCEPMHMFDPLNKSCRRIFCGRNFILRNGDCVPSEASVHDANVADNNESTISRLLNCSAVHFLAPHEFIREENGSVILVANGIRLSEGEYEFHEDNASIKVCTADNTTYQYISRFGETDAYLSTAGTSISIASLILKISLFFLLPEPKNIPSTVVIFLSTSLLVAQFLFLFGVGRIDLKEFCSAIGVLMHYAFLTSFFWMNALAFDIWKTFSRSRSTRRISNGKQLTYYCFYACGVSLVITFTAILFQWVFPRTLLNPQYGFQLCWISNRIALLAFFAFPLGVLLLANMLFFVTTSVKIFLTSKASKLAHENTGRKDRIRFILYVKLAFIMGLTWIFGFITAFARSDVLRYLFILFNSLQGFFIFLAFTNFRSLLRLKCMKRFFDDSSKTTTSELTKSTPISHTSNL